MRRLTALAATIVLAMLVAVGCGQFGKAGSATDNGSTAGGADTNARVTNEPFDEAERKRAGCGEIEELENKGREHVDEDVEYEDNPPVSGDHNPVPLDWGVYEDPQPTEQIVHNLEHGHIVIAYKGLSADEYDELKSHRDKDKFHLVLVPRDANPEDGVYYLAWDHRLYCEKPSAPALQKMIDDHRDQGPELFMNDPAKPDEDED